MELQKSISKDAAAEEKDDWVHLREDDTEEFIGYDHLEAKVMITSYNFV